MSTDNQRADSATPLQIAMLAALLDPASCKSGNSEDALLTSMALLEESTELCRKFCKMEKVDRALWLTDLAICGSPGAAALANAIANREKTPVVLTLATTNDGEDTLRPYLAKKANFEGKSGRKAWSTLRMVHDNFRQFFVYMTNKHNKENAERIQARELQDEVAAKAKGCSVGQLPSVTRIRDEYWRDGENEFEEFLEQYAVRNEKEIIRFEFPQSVVDQLSDWKRHMRTKGGVKRVCQLTRAELFPIPVKRKNPKKRK